MATIHSAAPTGPAATGVLPTSGWPPGALGQTTQPQFLNTSAQAIASGQMFLFAVTLPAGLKVSAITFLTGTTAGLLVTHSWAALLADTTFLQLAHSADQTSGGITPSVFLPFPMVTPYTLPATAKYWLAIAVTAGTMPTLGGTSTGGVQGGAAFGTIPVSGPGQAGVTGPGTDGVTAYTGPATAGNTAYAYVS